MLFRSWDVTQLFGTKDGGTEGHYYRFAKEGMRPWSGVNLADASGEDGCKVVDLGTDITNWNGSYIGQFFIVYSNGQDVQQKSGGVGIMCGTYAKGTWGLMAGKSNDMNICIGDSSMGSNAVIVQNKSFVAGDIVSGVVSKLVGVKAWYQVKSSSIKHFTSLFLSASSTADELTAMPADAIPLSEIQFADNNWSIEEAIYDAPEADANGVITPTAVTGQMRIQYSLDAAEQIDTLQKEYQALEARVTALENA